MCVRVCARATHVICNVKRPQIDQIAHKRREGGELVALQAEVSERRHSTHDGGEGSEFVFSEAETFDESEGGGVE